MKPLRSHIAGASIALAAVLVGCGNQKSPEQHLTDARNALAVGDHDTASQAVRDALNADSSSPVARLLFGRVLLAAGENKAAETELRRALEAGASVEDVYPVLAETMVAGGGAKRALDELSTKQLGTSASQAALNVALAQAKAQLKDADGAMRLLQQARSLQANIPAAQLVEARIVARGADGATRAMSLVDSVLSQYPADVSALRLKGELLMHRQGDANAAVAVFQSLVKLRPRDIDGQLQLAHAFMMLGRLDEARQQLEVIQKIQPRAFSTLLLDTQIAFAGKNFQLAKEKAQVLLKIAPDHPALSVIVGVSLLNGGSYQQAERVFSRMLHLNRNSVVARRFLAETKLSMGDPKQALELLAPLLSAHASDPLVLSLAANAHLTEGRYADAEQLFNRVLALRPADQQSRLYLAEMRLQQGQTERAISDLAVMTQSAGGVAAYGALINAHLRQSRFQDALKVCKEYANKQPASPLPYLLEARVLTLSGDPAGVRRALEQALAKDKSNLAGNLSLALLDRRQGKKNEARSRLSALVEAVPASPDAWIAFAAFEAASTGGGASSAEQDVLRRALEKVPSSAEIQVLLVQSLLKQKKHSEALALANKAAVAFRGRSDVLGVLAAAQLASGELNQAQNSYAELAQSLPRDVWPLLGLAKVQISNGSSDAAYRTVLRIFSTSPELSPQTRVAVDMIRSGQGPSGTERLVKDLKAQYPGQAWPHVLEGELMIDRSKPTEAMLAFKAGLGKAGDSPAAVGFNGMLINLGREAEAGAFASLRLKERPKDAGFLRHLGARALAQRDLEKAEAYYRRALDVAPDDALTLNNLAWVLVQRSNVESLVLVRKAFLKAPDSVPILDTYAAALKLAGKNEQLVNVLRLMLEQQPESNVVKMRLAKSLLESGDKPGAKALLTELERLGATFPEHAEVTALLHRL